MFLVLCSAVDRSGLWAFEQLRHFGVTPIHLLTTEHLSYASWNHRLGAAGNSVTITMPDGRVVDSEDVSGVLNRITTIGADQTNRAAPSDREYAVSEMNAFYLSWLYCLPGVVNRATPQGLCGRWRHPSEWSALAVRANLPMRAYRQSEEDMPDQMYGFPSHIGNRSSIKAIVFRDQIFGAELPSPVAKASVRLAALADLDLMGVEFEITPDHKLIFRSATPSPDLFVGGSELIRTLACSWQAQGELQ